MGGVLGVGDEYEIGFGEFLEHLSFDEKAGRAAAADFLEAGVASCNEGLDDLPCLVTFRLDKAIIVRLPCPGFLVEVEDWGEARDDVFVVGEEL